MIHTKSIQMLKSKSALLSVLPHVQQIQRTEIDPCTHVLSYSSSFSIKMIATDVKTENIKPYPNLFMTDENVGLSVQ